MVFSLWCGGVFVVVWWCLCDGAVGFCGEVVVFLWLCFCGGVVGFLCFCDCVGCGCVFVVVWLCSCFFL